MSVRVCFSVTIKRKTVSQPNSYLLSLSWQLSLLSTGLCLCQVHFLCVQQKSCLLYRENSQFCFTLGSQDTEPPQCLLFFFSHLQAAIEFCLPSRTDQWRSQFRFYFFIIFFSFESMSSRVFAEDRTISKSKLAPFISGLYFQLILFPSSQTVILIYNSCNQAFLFPTDCSYTVPLFWTCHSLNYFPAHPKAYSFQYAHRYSSIHWCART